ncbi:hypothetical protein OG512_47845 [Streptomyces sp. NBC_01378]|uniref:hypothetical protein n=1 Tax=Streptomyces sp. NBC_01378 TaxID=2903844 RepID=UPI0032431DF7
MKGAEALILELNRIVYSSGIASPITSKRGQDARLNYLKSEAGRNELRAQGVSDRAMRSWFTGKARPSKANLDRLDSAYWVRRRANLIRSGWLKRHLDNDGQGRRLEIYRRRAGRRPRKPLPRQHLRAFNRGPVRLGRPGRRLGREGREHTR